MNLYLDGLLFAFSKFFLDFLGIYFEYLVIVCNKCMIFRLFSCCI
jgi:hypothetical protein